jgi:hypothetical protein
MKCVQCERTHSGSEKVCEGCVEDAMRLMEGALGGRPTAAQVYRMFDMGGCGVSPLEQFRPRCDRKKVTTCCVGTRFRHKAVFPWSMNDGRWFNHIFETVCEVTEVDLGRATYRVLYVEKETNRPPVDGNSCPTVGSCPILLVVDATI